MYSTAQIITGHDPKSHILLVDDYPANILVASTYLELFGYSYDIATDGLEAVKFIKGQEYAAVIMDVQMPAMSGLEATRIIRCYENERRKRPVAIIAMTALARPEDREMCLAAGMTDYISKPYNPSELENKLRQATAQYAEAI